MRKIIATLVLVFVCSCNAWAIEIMAVDSCVFPDNPRRVDNIDIGLSTINVPILPGFVDVKEANGKYFDIMNSFSPKGVVLKGAYVWKKSRRGEDITHVRLQTNNDLQWVDIESAAFVGVKDRMRMALLKESKNPVILNKGANSIGEMMKNSDGEDIKASIMPLSGKPYMSEGDEYMVYAAPMNVALEVGDTKKKVEGTAVMGLGLVYVKGKIIHLIMNMVVESENDVRWSHEVLAEWSRQIIAANK